MTERKSTGNSPLLDMLKEVYDTKLRMKKVINMVLDSNSDDFEEYSTLAYNALVTKYNEGIRDGYNDGYHSLFPDVQLSEEDWSEFYKEFRNFSPSVPTYTTSTDIDNLTVLMTDSLRCRLLLKAVLETNSNEFVTYPDILESLYESWYQEAYDFAWDEGYADALEHYYEPAAPTVEQDNNTVVITNNEPDGVIYYSFDMGTTWTEYVAPFTINDTYMILVKCDVTEAHPYWRPGVTTVSYTTTYYLNYAPTVTLDESTFTFTVTNNDPNTKGTLWYKINNGSWIEYTGETNFDISADVIYAKYTYNGQTSPIATVETDYGLEIIFNNGNGTLEILNTYESLEGEYKLNNGNWTSWSAYNGDSRTFTNVDRIILRKFNRSLPQQSMGIEERAFNTTGRYTVKGYIARLYNGSLNFADLFYNDSNITNAYELVLPNRDELNNPKPYSNGTSFRGMFSGCTRLTVGPKTLPERITPFTCQDMFSRCTSLTTAPILPAVELPTLLCYIDTGAHSHYVEEGYTPQPTDRIWYQGAYYNSMFEGCTSLTVAPSLPATILGVGCYNCMFAGCTALVNAPTISAITGDSHCCANMFEGCTSLVNVPALSLTTFTTSESSSYCCEEMFKDCISLVNAPALPATTLAEGCYYYMFSGCTALVNAPALPATTLAEDCYHYMFYNCTSLTVAPELPATKLVSYCYAEMFYGCTNLNYVKCLAELLEYDSSHRFYITSDTDMGAFTVMWLDGVPNQGTFVKSRIVDWPVGGFNDGIPSGWTIQNAA